MGVYLLTVFFVDSISEAMRELESIQDKRDTVLCSAMLLVYAHKKCKTVGVYSTWMHKHACVRACVQQSTIFLFLKR